MFKENFGRGQFLITSARLKGHASFNKKHALKDNYVILYNDPLKLLPMVAQNGSRLGYVMGYPINIEEASLYTEAVTLSVRESNPSPHAFESALYTLGGRFIALRISQQGGLRRLYVDAGGSLSCFYSKENRAFASTIDLVEEVTLCDIQQSQSAWHVRWMDARSSSGIWFPGGLAPVGDWKVVLPNHYIDIPSYVAHRHWPKSEGSLSSASPFHVGKYKNIVPEAAEIISRQIRAVAKEHAVRIPLTGGKDSRSLLACAKSEINKISIHVSSRDRKGPDWDRILPGVLAYFFELPFTFDLKASHNCVRLTGFAGEVGRGYYHEREDKSTYKMNPNVAMKRLGITQESDRLDAAIDQWCSSLPPLDFFTALNLLYLEQRVGTTFSHVLYQSDKASAFSLYPYNHRRIYSLMMGQPAPYQQNSQFQKDIIAHKWPELGYFKYSFRKARWKDLRAVRNVLLGRWSLGNSLKNALFVLYRCMPREIKKMCIEPVVYHAYKYDSP